jgi:hypothetical protein
MANIFKTTLKKDVIADIANNGVREIRFPITKFWCTRLTDEYNLDEKVFTFRCYNTIELSSPSNKDTDGMTYVFDFVKSYIDGDEFVVEFKTSETENEDEIYQSESENNIEVKTVTSTEDINVINENITELIETSNKENDIDASDGEIFDGDVIANSDVYAILKDLFDDDKVLENFYEDENVFATNARQVIVLPKGRIIGFQKTLPVNNDVEVRIEFDMSDRIYFDSIPDFDVFVKEVLRTLSEIRKNNFVFVWRRNTGIFMDSNDRIYFGIKYSTRKSIGFNRKYNVQ